MFIPEKNLIFNKCLDHRDPPFTAGETANLHRQESHAHDAREILLVLKGKSGFYLNGKYFQAAPGCAFFVDHWVAHQQGYPPDVGEIVHIWIHLHDSRMFALPSIRGNRNQDSGCTVWEFPDCMLQLVKSRWDKINSVPEDLRSAYYSSIARLLYEEICFQSHFRKAGGSGEESIVSYVRNYIVMNHGRDSSMAELEKRTGYSRRHLMRCFKEEYSMTIGEYIDCVRRGFAATAGERMMQKEIAFQLGFKSPAAYWLWKKRDQKKRSAQHRTTVQDPE